MDWLQYVNNPYVFVVVVLALVFGGKAWLEKRADPPAVVNGPSAATANGSDKVRVLINEACRDCKQVNDIKAEIAGLRADFRGLERNMAQDLRDLKGEMSSDIRGVHERLDRVIEGQKR